MKDIEVGFVDVEEEEGGGGLTPLMEEFGVSVGLEGVVPFVVVVVLAAFLVFPPCTAPFPFPPPPIPPFSILSPHALNNLDNFVFLEILKNNSARYLQTTFTTISGRSR